ncbi:accessory factor UbiK family protein [Acinetobacter larvae]|uniref:Membrane fusogenic activity n=1 Tax=Acinetobacter larvae TaxID=1789224 RepID=A0A1B2M374_9GAMM|nr:accessory factor UbiK family protein [Acinetobacter larvae]AOA59632.1 membrane fusogenic activity [Acinetobacter larvae]
MIETLLQAILEQLDQPKKDLEHNLRALLSETITKMDLVSQAELERQKTALNNANQQLTALETQLTALEALLAQTSATQTTSTQ